MPKKVSWDDFQKGKEYKMWGHLFDMSQTMDLSGVNFIKNKETDLVGAMESQGTTPRQLTDLIGSLADLTSGSGDKGTPFIYIQGYFDNYTI